MASYRELTVLSSRCAPEFRDLCGARPSVSITKRNNEAVKRRMTLPGLITIRMTAFVSLPSATRFGVPRCGLKTGPARRV